jgi:hypothetical protein
MGAKLGAARLGSGGGINWKRWVEQRPTTPSLAFNTDLGLLVLF